MSKNLAKRWTRGLMDLRNDERGAESSEVILVLVLLVIGLIGAWAFLKGKLIDKVEQTGNCIDTAASRDSCCPLVNAPRWPAPERSGAGHRAFRAVVVTG